MRQRAPCGATWASRRSAADSDSQVYKLTVAGRDAAGHSPPAVQRIVSNSAIVVTIRIISTRIYCMAQHVVDEAQVMALNEHARTNAEEENRVDEEELLYLMELAETNPEETDSNDRAVAADLMALLRKVADLDQEGRALYPAELAWLKQLEDCATQTEKEVASVAADILRGADVLESRPGEDQAAVAAELRRQAAQHHAYVADAGRIATASRRLREKETRRMAAMEHVVDPNVMAFLARVAGEMDHYTSAVEGGAVDPAQPEEVATAASAADRVEEEMGRLQLWLMLASMDCEKRPGEEALAASLWRQADRAEESREAVHAFRASMRRYQVAAGTALHPEEEEGS